MSKNNSETIQLLGWQSLIPGLETAINTLQDTLNNIRGQLEFAKNGGDPQPVKRGVGRPPSNPLQPAREQSPPPKRHWASLTPEERNQKLKKLQTARRKAWNALDVPAGWVTTVTAAKLVGGTTGAIRQYAVSHNWKTRQHETVMGGHKLVLLRRSDVEAEARRRNGSGPVNKRGGTITDPYWSKMSPEERQAEMRRRIAKRAAKKEAAA